MIKKKFFCAGITLSAGFFLASSYVGCDEILFVVFFTLTVCSRSLLTLGCYINPVDLTANYVGPLTAVVNGMSSATGIFAPYIVGLMTTNVRKKFISKLFAFNFF